MTAPVSAGSVSTRIAPSSAAGSCSGRQTRSKNRDSGRNASLTDTSYPRGLLQLLQHRAADPGGEDVAGQQQHREPVDRGQRRAGEHVGRRRADRRGAGHGRQPVERAGVPDGRVHHRLLVAGQVVRQVGGPVACASSSAWPTPATLPWPKMPKHPAISRRSTPSRSLYWLARNRTRAWATVRRIVTSSRFLLGQMCRRLSTGAERQLERVAAGRGRHGSRTPRARPVTSQAVRDHRQQRRVAPLVAGCAPRRRWPAGADHLGGHLGVYRSARRNSSYSPYRSQVVGRRASITLDRDRVAHQRHRLVVGEAQPLDPHRRRSPSATPSALGQHGRWPVDGPRRAPRCAAAGPPPPGRRSRLDSSTGRRTLGWTTCVPTPRLRTSMPRSTRYWIARRVVGRETPSRSARSTSVSIRVPTAMSPARSAPGGAGDLEVQRNRTGAVDRRGSDRRRPASTLRCHDHPLSQFVLTNLLTLYNWPIP